MSEFEGVAKAIYTASTGGNFPWSSLIEDTRRHYIRLAEAAVAEMASHLTRVDIIGCLSPDAYAFRECWADSWALSIQDNGRTLKLFAEGDGTEAKVRRMNALAADFQAAQSK